MYHVMAWHGQAEGDGAGSEAHGTGAPWHHAIEPENGAGTVTTIY